MLKLDEAPPLRDIDPHRVYRRAALGRHGTGSGVGAEYFTISNDAVPSENVVACPPTTTQICIVGAWGRGKTGLALQDSDQSDWQRLFGKLEELRRLEPDWNGYGSIPPNATAEAHARNIMLELHKLNRIPERVVASADDGFGIYITSGKKYAMIECYNDGGIVIGFSDREGDIHNREITPESHTIRTGLQEALAFLDG